MRDLKGTIKFIKTVKLLRQVLFGLFVALVLVFICLHAFVNIFGKSLAIKKISQVFNREVVLETLSTSFPATIRITNIEAKGLFKVKEVVAGSGLFDIFRRSLRLSLLKVVNPELILARNPLPAQALAVQATPESAGALATTTPAAPVAPSVSSELGGGPGDLARAKFLLPRLLIRHLIITDGSVQFTDNIEQDRSIKIKVEKINLKADNVDFSGKGKHITYFNFSGLVPWRESQEAGRIEANGWVNLFKRDIQATLKVQDIDGVYLHPYYAKWVDLEKVRIERAKLNFTSDIQGLNNDITAACRLELTDIVRTPRSADESKEKAEKITDIVLDMFRALNQGKIVLDFTIKTKLDNPEFGIGDIKSAAEIKLSKARRGGINPLDVFFLPVKIVEGSVKVTTEITKAVIVGSFAVGNEFKNAIKGSFTREPKTEE